jgi:hypothetical protein
MVKLLVFIRLIIIYLANIDIKVTFSSLVIQSGLNTDILAKIVYGQ